MRQGRSARHYLIEGPLAASLQTTVALAARALDFPVAMVNILDEESRHTISMVGVGDSISLERERSLCDTVVRTGNALVVEDAPSDRRFANHPAVAGGDVQSYLGVPLLGRESLVVGTVCLMDRRPRPIDADQLARLAEFGKVVEDQLDLMRRLRERQQDGEIATAELARAIRSGEIVPWYQPIIELTTGRTVGYEALARWIHPSGEVEDPNSFVPLAEDSDVVIDLDLAVLRQALRDTSRWQQTNPAARMSVNLSTRHADEASGISLIHAEAQQFDIPPDCLDLELTETNRLATSMSAGTFVSQLRDHGYRVWLDDFGTGWSSLEYLLRLPVSGIKIDRVMAVALGSRVGNAVTRAMTSLARDLGLQTTIEGVASADHAALARSLGCDYAQGYHWSQPVPAASIDAGLLR